MRRITLTGLALVIVLVVGATAASTASASRLILSADGTLLPLGQEIELSGRENFAVNFSTLSGECRTPEYEEIEVYGTLGNISGGIDKVPFKNGRPVGEYEEPVEVVLECGTERGYGYVVWRPGGETLWLGPSDKASMKPASIGVLFEIFNDGEIEELGCTYFTKALRGTTNATTTRQPLTVALSGTLKRRNSPRTCPRTLHASFSFPRIETSEGTVEAQL